MKEIFKSVFGGVLFFSLIWVLSFLLNNLFSSLRDFLKKGGRTMNSINELPSVLQGFAEQLKANTAVISSLTSAAANVQVNQATQLSLDELTAALQAQTALLNQPAADSGTTAVPVS